MSKIKLYIAASIDGFIAREDGALDWLYALPNPNQIDHGYGAFLSSIDTVLMGRSTYEEILGFGVEWPYADCKTYVFTSRPDYVTATENTTTIADITKESIEKLRDQSGKDVWLVGGGKVITSFLNLELIDEIILTVIPTIIGKGIRLFADSPKETLFDLKRSEAFETGAVTLTYTKK